MKILLAMTMILSSLSVFACECDPSGPVIDRFAEKRNLTYNDIDVVDVEYKIGASTIYGLPYILGYALIAGDKYCNCDFPGERVIIKLRYVNKDNKQCSAKLVKPAIKRDLSENYKVRRHFCDK